MPATASMSASFSKGLVGVSIQTIFVFGADRRHDIRRIAHIDIGDVEAGGAAAHALQQAESAPIEIVRRDDMRVASSKSSTAEIAASPEAKANPDLPPSSAAMARSKAKRVGLWLRP